MYLAPELIKRQTTDHRVDLFALGVTAFEMFTGELPWERDESLHALIRRWVEVLPAEWALPIDRHLILSPCSRGYVSNSRMDERTPGLGGEEFVTRCSVSNRTDSLDRNFGSAKVLGCLSELSYGRIPNCAFDARHVVAQFKHCSPFSGNVLA